MRRRYDPITAARRTTIMGAALVLAAAGCPEPAPPLPDAPGPLPDPPVPDEDEASGRIVHGLQPLELRGSEETMTCYSWTVDNDAPLYVEAVDFQNAGSFHHSNWFVVPEDVYPGDDGFWPCAQRGFNDVSAALSGTVLFAQSTQAQRETMAFGAGATIRIPARSKIVAGVHLLNLGPDPRKTAAWLSLDVIHPALVEATLSPILLSFLDLNVPAGARARFFGTCSGSKVADLEALSLHYALPHFHRNGTAAKLSLFEGGVVNVAIDQEGFGAQPMGRMFDPPIVIEDLTGFEFSCDYENPYDEALSWGIGINEMCLFLGFADTGAVFVGTVDEARTPPTELEDGTLAFSGFCRALSVPRGRAYDLPSFEERMGLLELPPAGDEAAPRPPTCEDVAGTYDAQSPPELADVQSRVFGPWCSFSSCHGSGRAASLDLRADAAREALVDVASVAVDMPRVTPGDAEGSYLYRLISACDPEVDGVVARHMPVGAPTLLDPELVGLVRAWIEAGAP